MNANQLNADLRRKTDQLTRYMRDEFPRMAVRKSKRFIDGNFRAQGWQGKSFQAWKANIRKGTILIKTGRLRRGTQSEQGPFTARIYNAVPYARFHNRGFKGKVTVRAHTRNKYRQVRVGTGRFTKAGTERTRTMHQVSSSSQVKSHIRSMNTPRRQFMPENIQDSPVLFNAMKRELVNNIKTIFN